MGFQRENSNSNKLLPQDSHKAAQALQHFKDQKTFLWNCAVLEKIILLPVEEESSTFVLVRSPKYGPVKLRKI